MDFRFVLVLGLLSSLSVSLLTWYAVLHQGTAVELTPEWASLFSARGGWGVVEVGAGKVLLLLLLYWAYPPLSVLPCTLYLLDLAHDLSAFFFGSSPFLLLLGGPDALLALFLTLLADGRFSPKEAADQGRFRRGVFLRDSSPGGSGFPAFPVPSSPGTPSAFARRPPPPPSSSIS